MTDEFLTVEQLAQRLGWMLAYGWERIEKSRVGNSERGTKSGPSNRQIRLHDNLVDVLKEHGRFILEPEADVFTTPKRTPIDEGNFYKREWLPMLRKLKVRPRPFYNTRHSYASFMLSVGAKMSFISAQTGDKEDTLKNTMPSTSRNCIRNVRGSRPRSAKT